MTDKEYREQKKRVRKFIDKWFKTMGLGWFRVTFEWSREHDGTVAAKTESSWQYKQATITWNLPYLQKFDDETVESVVVHEFTHILLSGLAQNAIEGDNPYSNQVNEYTTEIVANAIEWARTAGKHDATKEGKHGKTNI